MFRNNLVLHNRCTVGGFKLQQSVMFGYKQSVIIACESECFIQNYFIRLNRHINRIFIGLLHPNPILIFHQSFVPLYLFGFFFPSIICSHPKFENNIWVHDMIIHPKIEGVSQASAKVLNYQTSD
jgi:hypothetical protein